jgi:uncharacterized protein (UPF0333 family)
MIAMLRSTAQSRRGQVSLEFMLLFILFLVAITTALMVSINRSHSISQAQIDLSSNRVLSDAADRINTAFLEGDGFSIKVTLPEKIMRMDYTIEVKSNEVLLRLDGKTYVTYLLTNNVTGSFVKGTNAVTNQKGEILITEDS